MKICEVGLFNTCLAMLKALIEVNLLMFGAVKSTSIGTPVTYFSICCIHTARNCKVLCKTKKVQMGKQNIQVKNVH